MATPKKEEELDYVPVNNTDEDPMPMSGSSCPVVGHHDRNHHDNHHHQHQQENHHHNNNNGNHHHHKNHRTKSEKQMYHPRPDRELHTAESIVAYLQDHSRSNHHETNHGHHSRDEEDDHHRHHGHHDREEEFKDYLEAQRHLQARRFSGMARRLSAAPHHLFHHHHRHQQHDDDEEEQHHANHNIRQSSSNLSASHTTTKDRKTALHAINMLGQRTSTMQQHHMQQLSQEQAEFQAFLNYENYEQEYDDKDDNSSHGRNPENKETSSNDDSGDSSHHHHSPSLSIPWYCHPVQRQRWDDDQVLPHINWGDLFFDLFYVAAAYNLGVMLISSMNSRHNVRGVIYFVAIFGGLYNAWEQDVVYTSRYTVVDYVHRLIAVLRYVCVAFAVLSIKPIDYLSDKHSVETFCLVLALLAESLIQLGLHLELYYVGDGDRKAIQHHTKIKLQQQFLPACLTYLTATIIAGYSFLNDFDDYHGHNVDPLYSGKAEDASHSYDNTTTYNHTADSTYLNDDNHHRVLAAAAKAIDCSSYEKDDGHRSLAGASDYDGCSDQHDKVEFSIADVPLFLLCAIYFINIVATLFRKYCGKQHTGKDVRELFVPNNVDYMIHRYGEWIMLMIGESILSLLIVETIESGEYYAIASIGCLTVIVLQMLKFESEPSSADGHALWRSTTAATLFSLLIQVLSMCLIAFGVSYKVMLTTVYKKELEEELEQFAHRRLAGVPTISDLTAARLFSYSLLGILLSLECMMGTHKGVTQTYQLLFHEIETFHYNSLNWPLLIISILKIGIFAFTATLSQWATEPIQACVMGCIVVVAMATTRIVGWGFVHHGDTIKNTVSFLTSQTTDAAAILVERTQSMAKKTLTAVPLKGLNPSRNNGSTAASREELAIDQALWETSFDAIVVTDRVGVIKYVNSTTIEEFGYEKADDLIGQNVAILVGGGMAAYHSQFMEAFNKGERKESTIGKQRELMGRRRDESEFKCLIGIKEIPNTSLLIGHIRVLDNVMGASTYSASAEEKHEVDETSFDSIIVIDPTGIILNVNLTTLGEFGYSSKDELIGKSVDMLVGGGEAVNHSTYLANFDRANRNASTIGQREILHAKRKDDSEFPVVIGIKRSPDRDALIGYIRNMTGIAPEIDAMKERTKYLVDDSSFDSIVITDDEGKILQVNATAVEEFGYNAKAEMIGNNITMLVGGGQAKHHARYMKKFKKKGKDDSTIGKQRKLKARRKDGSEFVCVIGIRKVPDTEWLIGYIRSTEGFSRLQAYDDMSQKTTESSRAGTSVGGSSLPDSTSSHHGGSSVNSDKDTQSSRPEGAKSFLGSDTSSLVEDKCGVKR